MNWRTIQTKEHMTKEECHHALAYSVWAIRFIPNPTEDMIQYVLEKNPETLKYINKDIPEEQMKEYVAASPVVLKYIMFPSEELCMIAVRNNPRSLEFVPKQTERICLEALRKDVSVFPMIQEQTETICLEALRSESFDVSLIKIPYTPEMVKTRFKTHSENDVQLLCSLEKEEFTKKDVLEILLKNPNAYSVFKDRLDEEDILSLLTLSPGLIFSITDPTFEMKKTTLENEPSLLARFPYDEELTWVAIRKDPSLIEFVQNPTDEMFIFCIDACDKFIETCSRKRDDVSEEFFFYALGAKERVLSIRDILHFYRRPISRDLFRFALRERKEEGVYWTFSRDCQHLFTKDDVWFLLENRVVGCLWNAIPASLRDEKVFRRIIEISPQELFWMKDVPRNYLRFSDIFQIGMRDKEVLSGIETRNPFKKAFVLLMLLLGRKKETKRLGLEEVTKRFSSMCETLLPSRKRFGVFTSLLGRK